MGSIRSRQNGSPTTPPLLPRFVPTPNTHTRTHTNTSAHTSCSDGEGRQKSSSFPEDEGAAKRSLRDAEVNAAVCSSCTATHLFLPHRCVAGLFENKMTSTGHLQRTSASSRFTLKALCQITPLTSPPPRHSKIACGSQ